MENFRIKFMIALLLVLSQLVNATDPPVRHILVPVNKVYGIKIDSMYMEQEAKWIKTLPGTDTTNIWVTKTALLDTMNNKWMYVYTPIIKSLISDSIIANNAVIVPYISQAIHDSIANLNLTEKDPIFKASVSYGILQADTARWNNKLSSFTETDPTVSALVKGITATDTTRWGSVTPKTVHDSIQLLKDRLAILEGVENVDRTIYVDAVNGSDSNDGKTSGTAFKTIRKALGTIKEVVNSTVTVQLLAGDYTYSGLFDKLSSFSGSGRVNVTGSYTSIPITVTLNPTKSLYNKILTYNGSSSFSLSVDQLKGTLAGTTSTAPTFPVIGNTVDSIAFVAKTACIYLFTMTSTLSDSLESDMIYQPQVVVYINKLNLVYPVYHTITFYNSVSLVNCIVDNESGITFYNSKYPAGVASSTLNTKALSVRYTTYFNLTYNYFRPFSSTITGTSNDRVAVYNSSTNAYCNYIENPVAYKTNMRSGMYMTATRYGGTNVTSLGVENAVSALYLGSNVNFQPSLDFATGYIYGKNINYLVNWFSSTVNINNTFIINPANLVDPHSGSTYKPSIGYYGTNKPASSVMFDLSRQAATYVKGDFFPPIENNLTQSCLYNAVTSIPVGKISQNSSVEVKYTIKRSTSVYTGTFTIIPGTSTYYLNQPITSDSNLLGVTITAAPNGTTPDQIDLSIAVDNSSTNNVTFNYNVTRVML